MGIFDKLLQKETPLENTSSNVTSSFSSAKISENNLQKTNPTVEDIMKNAQAMVNSTSSGPLATPTLTEILKKSKEEDKAEIKVETNPEISKEITPEVKPEISIPENLEVVAEQPKEVEKTVEKIKIEMGETPERIFVGVFLQEINDLIEKGKELEQANEERNINAAKNEETSLETETLRGDAKKIEDSIKAFLDVNDAESLHNKLNEVLTGYQGYLELFEAKINDELKSQRVADNTLLTKINSKKAEISRLLKDIGGENGQMIFERIKTFIRDTERTSHLAKEKFDDVSPQRINEINTLCVKAQAEDHVGMKMLAENGGMVEILTRVFTNLPANDNVANSNKKAA